MTTEIKNLFEQAIGLLQHEALFANYKSQQRADEVISRMKTLLLVDPTPKIGYWIPDSDRPKSTKYFCSVCGKAAYDDPKPRKRYDPKRCSLRYCPHCSLPMENKHE